MTADKPKKKRRRSRRVAVIGGGFVWIWLGHTYRGRPERAVRDYKTGMYDDRLVKSITATEVIFTRPNTHGEKTFRATWDKFARWAGKDVSEIARSPILFESTSA